MGIEGGFTTEGRNTESRAERADWSGRIESATRAMRLASAFVAAMSVAEAAQAEVYVGCAEDKSYEYVVDVLEQAKQNNEALAAVLAQHDADKAVKAEAKAALAAGLATKAAYEEAHARYLETGEVSPDDAQKDDIPNILELRMNKWIAGNNALTSGLEATQIKMENRPVRKELINMLAACKFTISNLEEGNPAIEPLSELVDDIKAELDLD